MLKILQNLFFDHLMHGYSYIKVMIFYSIVMMRACTHAQFLQAWSQLHTLVYLYTPDHELMHITDE